ncbi:MAG: PAS domain S-box protein, partial [Thermoanaerobaculia bacterium]
GEIVLLNVQAEKQFGYRRDELVGQRVTNIIPEGFAERLIADGTRSAADALAQQIGTGIELVALRKDGSRFPIEIMLSPLQSADGILVTAAIRDISVRKAAKEHLAQMEGRYRGLLEAAPDAMVVVNKAGEIVLLNVQAEKQFGYRRDELVGQQVTNIIPEGFAERLIADGTRSAADALAQHIGMGIELSALRKDGSEFPIEIMLSPLQSAEGILVTAAIRDITDRKGTEVALHEKNAEMERANQAKDRFLASMSHELRTPLNGIIGFAEFLADGKPGALNGRQKEYLGDILASGRHLLQLINDVLDVGKVQAGKMKLSLGPFRLLDVMEEVFAGVRPLAENKHIVMMMTIAPELGTVVLDQQRFRQILFNLLSNALKFTDDGGRVGIVAAADGADRFRLSIRDSGIGIEAADMHRLFTEFEQLETGTARRFGGTGLGLALTREIVNLMGGVISVESEIGKGSEFTVVLPMSAQEETS